MWGCHSSWPSDPAGSGAERAFPIGTQTHITTHIDIPLVAEVTHSLTRRCPCSWSLPLLASWTFNPTRLTAPLHLMVQTWSLTDTHAKTCVYIHTHAHIYTHTYFPLASRSFHLLASQFGLIFTVDHTHAHLPALPLCVGTAKAQTIVFYETHHMLLVLCITW